VTEAALFSAQPNVTRAHHRRLRMVEGRSQARAVGARPGSHGRFDATDPAATITPTVRWEDVMIMVAGGPGKHSVVVPTFGATRAVTARIEA
jgi:hypothetical protein